MSGRLSNKRAIITGGGLGLGEGIVRKFVAEGAQVLIFELNAANGEKVAASLPQGQAVNFTGDVTKEEDWRKALERCKEAFGGCEVVVNNAGVVHRSAVGWLPAVLLFELLTIISGGCLQSRLPRRSPPDAAGLWTTSTIR